MTPGTKERLVQIMGPSEDNIERAKELIESTIKRNASPVPFEPLSNSYEMSSQMPDNQILESNEMFEAPSSVSNSFMDNLLENEFKSKSLLENEFKSKSLLENEFKPKSYNFSVNVGNETIILKTTNFSLGHKSKQLLDQYFSSLEKGTSMNVGYEASDSSGTSDDEVKPKKEVPHINANLAVKSDGHSLQRQYSDTNIDESVTTRTQNLQRSSSQGTVPVGRTSMRYMNASFDDVPDSSSQNKKLIYDRDFLLNCAHSPLSQQMPLILTQIAEKIPLIIRQ